jgi:branched-chain amino acid transport system permease protein
MTTGSTGASDAASLSVTEIRRTWTSTVAGAVLVSALGVLVSVPWWGSQGLMRDFVEFFTLLALAQMWNLLAGYAGLVSIGQQAFIGIGAYSLYMIADKGDVHPFAAVALAGLVAAAVSLPTAALAFRLRGGYFAICTWVIAEALALLTINGADVGVDLGGGVGVTIVSAAGLDRDLRAQGTYWWALAAGAGSVLLVYAILRSRIGLALTAIRDDETAARSVGVNVLRTKVLVWIVAAFGCGVAGAVIYLNLVRVEPAAAYDVNWTAFMIFIVVIGGIGTIEGPIMGTVIFFTLQEQLSDYGVWYLIILGSVGVLAAVWVRGGIWGVVERRFRLQLFPVQRRVRLRADGQPASFRGVSSVFPRRK